MMPEPSPALVVSQASDEAVETSVAVPAPATTEAPAAPAGRRGPRYSIIRVVSGQMEAPKRSITVEEAPALKAKTSAPKTFTDPTLARTGSALIEDEEARKKRSTLSPRTKSDEELLFKSTDYLRRERVYQPKKKKISIGGGMRSSSKSSTVQASAHKRVVEFDTRMSVEDLAGQLAVKSRDVVKKLESLGVEMPDEVDGHHDWYVEFETAQLVAGEFAFEARDVTFNEEAILEAETKTDEKDFKSRPPVVTIMGHVDHGKTSLLDTIRRARVAAGEAGGITQHIGAYTVKVSDAIKNLQNMSEDKKDKKEKKKEEKAPAKAAKKSKEKSAAGGGIDLLTFLDTPGHAAFSSMRARGAKVTDIVILVVSAVDGVMPQTKEAVEHAKAAGVPLIVAVNKCDLPEANPDRIKQQLGDFGILPEEWGGETIFVNLSAKTGEGVDKLLEMLQIQAEVLDLKARSEGFAEGTIIEAKLDKGRGPLATVLIKSGVLKVGDYIVAGTQTGKVRALIDDKGAQVREAGPSTPVEILGLGGVPEAGEQLNAVTDERASKTLSEHRMELKKAEAEKAKSFTAEDLFARMASGDLRELAIILKSDVKGSAEAISAALLKLPQNKVRLKILSTGVGGVSESDVLLASASKALIVGFNVRPDNKAQAEAERRGVTIKSYSIIYELLDEITQAMEGLLAPTLKESVTGRLEVRNVFMITKVGQVAGCYVTKGKVARSNQVRLIRDGRVIYTGKISGLKRFKDDAKEVAEGFECGLSIEGYNDIKVGDNVESFAVESSVTKLTDGPTAQA
jgi:translation initiation factor IF-2